MADASAGPQCPVLDAWGKSEVVLKRLLEKDLVIVSEGRLTRGTVTANKDLLMPLIELVGTWDRDYTRTMCVVGYQ